MTLQLPPIRIDELTPATRDWLLATAATQGKDPQAVLRETLDRAAERDGFHPAPTPSGQQQPAA